MTPETKIKFLNDDSFISVSDSYTINTDTIFKEINKLKNNENRKTI